jgi:hypothetical protein
MRIPPMLRHVPRPGPCLLLLLALGTLGCAHRVEVATVPRQGTLAAVRERQEWIAGRLRAMRAAEKTGGGEAETIRRELEEAGVDWRSFLTPVRGVVQGSCCLYGEWPKNHTLRQIAQKLNLVRDVRQIFGIRDPASDLARDGSVLDSAFFTNRDVSAITAEEMRLEVEEQGPHGTIYITARKKQGVSEGFDGIDENGDFFVFILDPKGFDEMNTAAEVMGSAILRLAGYYVTYPAIVTLDDLELETEAAEEEGLTQRDVQQFKGRRATATRGLKLGYKGGPIPWTYWVFRDRREVRALQVFGAWINNYDQVDHNTAVSIFDKDTGLVRYHVIDTSSAFGSASNRVKEPAAGYVNNSIDLHRLFTTPLRWLATPFGYEEPWDPAQPIVSPAVGRFDSNLKPRLWKPQYPNLAYEDMDEEDAEWAARIIGQFSDEMIDAVVGLAEFSNPVDTAHMAKTLKARRDIIVRTYLEED